MPLQVISEALNLPDSVVRWSEPMWGFATTIYLGTSTGLLFWRSVWVRDSDKVFASVADLMSRAAVEVLIRDTIADPHMMHGRLEGVVALLHPLGPRVEPSTQQQIFTDVFTDWGDFVPITELAGKLYRRCQHVLMN